MTSTSNGGSDIQYRFYQKWVEPSIQQQVNLYRIPNPNARSLYHIDGIIDQTEVNVAWTQQSYDMIESLNLVNQQDQFDRIICVSEWQKEQYRNKLGADVNNLTVIQNGIIPFEEHTKPKNGPINLVYMSTPYRGLDVLLQAFQYIDRKDVCLHVFSSMKIYGQDDSPYESLYDYCKQHPRIVYHGSVPHDDLLTALREIHILAYPSTFEETSCISVLEAMSAQLAIVCSNYGALKETTAGFATLYEYTESKLEHAEVFARHLRHAIDVYDQSNHRKQKDHVDSHHDWRTVIKSKWEHTLKEVIDSKPAIRPTNLYYG